MLSSFPKACVYLLSLGYLSQLALASDAVGPPGAMNLGKAILAVKKAPEQVALKDRSLADPSILFSNLFEARQLTCGSGSRCGSSCCSSSEVCCSDGGCCPNYTYCSETQGYKTCCPTGEVCNEVQGCVDPGYVLCKNAPFCCPIGETCLPSANNGAGGCSLFGGGSGGGGFDFTTSSRQVTSFSVASSTSSRSTPTQTATSASDTSTPDNLSSLFNSVFSPQQTQSASSNGGGGGTNSSAVSFRLQWTQIVALLTITGAIALL